MPRSEPAVLVADTDEPGAAPRAFEFYSDNEREVAGITHVCPCGWPDRDERERLRADELFNRRRAAAIAERGVPGRGSRKITPLPSLGATRGRKGSRSPVVRAAGTGIVLILAGPNPPRFQAL